MRSFNIEERRAFLRARREVDGGGEDMVVEERERGREREREGREM